MSEKRVDLPAPFGPTSPIRSPRFTWSETSSKRTRPAKDLVTGETVSIAGTATVPAMGRIASASLSCSGHLLGNNLGQESVEDTGAVIVTSANEPVVVDSSKRSEDRTRIIEDEELAGGQFVKKSAPGSSLKKSPHDQAFVIDSEWQCLPGAGRIEGGVDRAVRILPPTVNGTTQLIATG